MIDALLFNRTSLSQIRRLFGTALLWSVPLTGLIPYLFYRDEMNNSILVAVLWHIVVGVPIAFILLKCLINRNRTKLLKGPLAALIPVGTVTLLAGSAIFIVAAMGLKSAHIDPEIRAVHTLFGTLFVLLELATFRRNSTLLVVVQVPPTVSFAATLLILTTAAFAGTVYTAETYYRSLTSTNDRQSGNPLFPAGTVSTTPASSWKTTNSKNCTQSGCHDNLKSHGSIEGHSKAGSSALYNHSLTNSSADQKRWCQGCHQPEQLLTGASSTTGVSCISCHAMSHVDAPTGNGQTTFTPPAQYPGSRSESVTDRRLSKFIMHLRPAPHVSTLRGPDGMADRSMMCAPCHRLSVNTAQNHYKFLRLDNTWSDWQKSSWSGESAHVYLAKVGKKDCVSCHISSPDSPPAARRVSIVLAALNSVEKTTRTSLSWNRIFAKPDSTIRFDLLIQGPPSGHSYFSGASGTQGAKLEISFSKDGENWQQLIDPQGDHIYGQIGLDDTGKKSIPGRPNTVVTTVFNRTIPSQFPDVVRFRLRLHGSMAQTKLRARLIETSNTSNHNILGDHIFALNEVGDIQDDLISKNYRRFYVDGLMEQHDSLTAKMVVRQMEKNMVTLEEQQVIGLISKAEGDLLSAKSAYEIALRLAPQDPQNHVRLGGTLRLMGQFDLALQHLIPVTKKFPRDRELWMEIGLCYLQSGINEQAEEAFEHVLAVDPDDAPAHYNLMQAYTRQRKITAARREEAIFKSLQEDEPLRMIRDPYLKQHPDIVRESQPIHVHELQLPARFGKTK